MIRYWWVGSDNLVTITGLQDEAPGGGDINSGTVTGVLSDSDGAQVGSDIVFARDTSESGKWYAVIADDIGSAGLVAGSNYTLAITAIAANGARAVFHITRLAKYHKEP